MFEGLSENDKENMTLEEFTRYEDERQKFNVFKTCAELAGRVNDSPGPGGTLNPMIGIVCEVPEELFYWDSEYLNAYLGASQSKKTGLPGYSYYTKIKAFVDTHFQVGELYMEYRKADCAVQGEEMCEHCKQCPWIENVIDRVPRPVPGENGKFLSLEETPPLTEGGDRRPPDDFQPRAQLKIEFAAGNIVSSDDEAIKKFTIKFGVSGKLVIQQLHHLEHLQYKKKRRSQHKIQAKETHQYIDIDWEKLYETRKLKTVLVKDLDSYISANSITVEGSLKKQDKILLVEANIAHKLAAKLCHQAMRQT